MDLLTGRDGLGPETGLRGHRQRFEHAVAGHRGLVVVAVGAVVLLVVAIGSLMRFSTPPSDPPLEFAPGVGGDPPIANDPFPQGQRESEAAEIVVHVGGAVTSPGVHALTKGSRVNDAVTAAGGALAEADLDRINLAAPLTDGGQVMVPLRGAPGAPATVAGGGVTPAPALGLVSLSLADLGALDALPGIGPSTAAAIVEYRTANGPFTVLEDLLEVRGIGEAKLEALRDLVVP